MWHARPIREIDLADVQQLAAVDGEVPSAEVLLGSQAVMVRDAGRIVAWGLVADDGFTRASVIEDFTGQGIGAWLVRWSEHTGRRLGLAALRQRVQDPRAQELLAEHGYLAADGEYVKALG